MRGWIYVLDHAYVQMTSSDGRYRLENVPAGEYQLEMAHPAGGLRWSRKIEIREGDRLELDIHVSPDNKLQEQA